MKEIVNLLSDWRTTAVLLILYAAALGGATFIEVKMGSQAARSIIYTSWWMYVLYGAFILNFIFVSLKMKLHKRKRWGAMMLHYGLVVTVIGAMITHLWGYDGIMHIREGESSNVIVMDDGSTRQVPMSVKLNKFSIQRYYGSNSPSSFQSDVTITHKGTAGDYKIFMNNISRVAGYRFYQTSYDQQDERGTYLTVNYDPIGTAVTYLGYFLLFLGMIWAVCEPGSRLRQLNRQLAKGD